jgi:hypothetical protein
MELYNGQNLLFDKMLFSDSIHFYIRLPEVYKYRNTLYLCACVQRFELVASAKDFPYYTKQTSTFTDNYFKAIN